MMTPLRQQLETALDFISRAALGHDTGHCVHFANKAEAELRSVIDVIDTTVTTNRLAGVRKFSAEMLSRADDSESSLPDDVRAGMRTAAAFANMFVGLRENEMNASHPFESGERGGA